jgi:osmotically-inducible protein OsmY
MSSNSKSNDADGELDLKPSLGEHGVDGYTETAVGGFGESYAFQVAHGAESDEPGIPSATQGGPNGIDHDQRMLEHAVQKALAHAHIDAADLRIDAHGSVVRLRGSVRQLFEKAELEARARAVPGVSTVVSEIAVLRSDESA